MTDESELIEPMAKRKKCPPGKCVCTIVIVDSVFTIYRCAKCGTEEWL